MFFSFQLFHGFASLLEKKIPKFCPSFRKLCDLAPGTSQHRFYPAGRH